MKVSTGLIIISIITFFVIVPAIAAETPINEGSPVFYETPVETLQTPANTEPSIIQVILDLILPAQQPIHKSSMDSVEKLPFIITDENIIFPLTSENPEIIISDANNKSIDKSDHSIENENLVIIADLKNNIINKRVETEDIIYIIRRSG